MSVQANYSIATSHMHLAWFMAKQVPWRPLPCVKVDPRLPDFTQRDQTSKIWNAFLNKLIKDNTGSGDAVQLNLESFEDMPEGGQAGPSVCRRPCFCLCRASCISTS